MDTTWMRLAGMLVRVDTIARIVDISTLNTSAYIVKFKDGSDYIISNTQVGYQKIAELFMKGEYL